jgi:predicted DNA-binding transcriptional regulator AlpA
MSQMNDNLLPGPRVDARYGISAMTRWRWQRNRALDFPKPLKINGRCYWRVDELSAWECGCARKTIDA